MSDDGHEQRWQPHAKPISTSRPLPEPLWETVVNHVRWSAEVRFLGEGIGWEGRLFRDTDFFASRRFDLKAAAIGWANVERADVEKGD